MGAFREKGKHEPADLYEAHRQRSEVRKQNDLVKRAEVGRLVRAGLSDFKIGKRLHISDEKVAAHREALGLKANTRGGALD